MFQRFLELLFAQSGGMFEATRFAAPCEVSRQTISNYLTALEATFVAHLVRPFSSRRANEIVAAPKVYGFDTVSSATTAVGARCAPKTSACSGEHFVLNEIQARLQRRDLRYWRNKQGAEVDFVLAGRGERSPVAIECKWRAGGFAPAALSTFRRTYPDGPSFVVATDVNTPNRRRFDDLEVEFVSLGTLIERLAEGEVSERS